MKIKFMRSNAMLNGHFCPFGYPEMFMEHDVPIVVDDVLGEKMTKGYPDNIFEVKPEAVKVEPVTEKTAEVINEPEEVADVIQDKEPLIKNEQVEETKEPEIVKEVKFVEETLLIPDSWNERKAKARELGFDGSQGYGDKYLVPFLKDKGYE